MPEPVDPVKPDYHPVLLGKRGLSPHCQESEETYPTLWGIIAPKYDAKQRLTREPATVSLRVDGSLFRVTIVCPTERLQTVMQTDSLVDLLDQLDRFLSEPATSWTPTYDAKKKAGQGLRSVLE